LEELHAAETAIDRLRQVSPDNEELLSLQAHALIRRGNYADAASALARLRERSKAGRLLAVRLECYLLSATHDQTALQALIDRWREPEQPIPMERAMISRMCAAFGLGPEALEQIAAAAAEGGVTSSTLVSYAVAAMEAKDTSEARDLLWR